MADARICTKCKVEKPFSDFHKDKSRPGGVRYVCKPCTKVYDSSVQDKRNQYLRDHPEKRVERRTKAIRAMESSRRRARERDATPAWRDDWIIGLIYKTSRFKSKLTGIDHNVDHIVPMVSDVVCGLHCQDNMRVITAESNRRKSNSKWPNMWR